MNERKPRRIGPGGLVLIVLALILLALLGTRQNRTLGLRQSVQFDDFVFTVEDAARLPADSAGSKGGESSSADPGDYLVRMRVDNRAKRVPFTFSGQSFAFVDLTGKNPMTRPSAERSPSGELVPLTPRTLKAGESATVEYVYSLPPEHGNLRLRVLSSGPLGDLLEWLFFGIKQFKLP
jgi:hypothetical protein